MCISDWSSDVCSSDLLHARLRGQAHGSHRMKFRLWPRSLVGQLVFAVAVTLFVAQAINFALLVRGQRQQFLAHGGGMAVARIIDEIGRASGGERVCKYV